MKSLATQLKAEPVVICGLGGIFPQANSLLEFWDHLLARKELITDIDTRNPHAYWKGSDYFDPQTPAEGKTYSRVGAYLPETPFDPLRFGIPPKSMEAIAGYQLLALVAAEMALTDAGLNLDQSTPAQRENVSTIIGHTGTGYIGFEMMRKTEVPHLKRLLAGYQLPPALIDDIVDDYFRFYPDWQEATFPGALSNIVSGRIANRFDLGGTNFTCDAACATSLTALRNSLYELLDGSADAVLTGGINVDMTLFSYIGFSRLKALSPSGHLRPFDTKADGMILGDACSLMVLKREADAVRDGNRIYARIVGLGSGSDGKAKSIFAPRFEGQLRAIDRAYRGADFGPDSISFLEAHGTGTPVGDAMELKSISSRFQGTQRRHSIALGSVKAQVGHTRVSAGAVAVTKLALALHQKFIPPMNGVDTPIEALADSPFYLTPSARPWITPTGAPRRAAANAFGFGGINYHIVLEEAQPEHQAPYRLNPTTKLFIVHGADRAALEAELNALHERLTGPDGSKTFFTAKLPATIPATDLRLGFMARDRAEALAQIQRGLGRLGEIDRPWSEGERLFFYPRGKAESDRVVALFPGQGAQYLHMGLALGCNFPELRAQLTAFETAHADADTPLSATIYPRQVRTAADVTTAQLQLTATHNAQPAIGAITTGIWDLLARAGFAPDMAIGHSYGELTALYAAGVLSAEQIARLSVLRGRLTSDALAHQADPGRMFAVAAGADAVRAALQAHAGKVVITNENSATQTVIGGPSADVEAAKTDLESQGLRCVAIPTAGAFHTSLLTAAATPFREQLQTETFGQPTFPVYANLTGEVYPENADISDMLAQQLLQPVRFAQAVRAAYDQGARIFVELGPNALLSRFVEATLTGEADVHLIALDRKAPKPAEAHLDDTFRRGVLQLNLLGVPTPDFDPYEARDQLHFAPELSDLTVPLDGGAYLRPETLERRLSITERPRAKSLESYMPKSEPISAAPAPAAPTSQNALLQLSQVHREFIQLQGDYLQLLSRLSAGAQTAAMTELNRIQDSVHQAHQTFLAQFGGATPTPPMPTAAALALPPVPAPIAAPVPAPIAPAVPPPAIAPELPASSILDEVKVRLFQVLEDMGYPASSINGDMDLETELGVDSIKRLELLAPISEFLPKTEADLDFAELSSKRSLNAIFAFLEQHLPAATPPAPAARPVSSPPVPAAKAPVPPPTAPNLDEVKTRLYAVLEDMGYPAGSINGDMDLEAELGVDSIKRLELLAPISEFLPKTEAELDFAELSSQRTLNDIFRFLAKHLQPAAHPIRPADRVTYSPNGHAPAAEPIRVESIEIVAAPLSDAAAVTNDFAGHWLITADADGLAEDLAAQLRERGGAVTVVAVDALDPDALPESVRGVVLLAPTCPTLQRLDEVLAADQRAWLEAAFRFAQGVEGAFDLTSQPVFLSVSRSDGTFGQTSLDPLTLDALGIAGLTKSLRAEWPDVTCRHVDLNRELTATDQVDLLLEELAQPQGPAPEVARNQLGKRWKLDRVTLDDADAADADLNFDQHVTFVSGGGKGVTFACVQAFATAHPGTLIIAGRSPLDAPEPAWAHGVSDPQHLTAKAIAHLKAHGSARPIIEGRQQVTQVLAQRELTRNLATLRATGSTVHYLPVDITNAAALAQALPPLLQQTGPLTGIIHGAGNLADKRFAEKTTADYTRVVAPKLAGLAHLLAYVDPTALRHLTLFASVSGYFGNAGQTDYALANDTLNRVAQALQQWLPNTDVKAINWGAWEGGMMTPELIKLYQKLGLPLIPLAAGAQIFLRLLARRAESPVLLVGAPDQVPVISPPASPRSTRKEAALV